MVGLTSKNGFGAFGYDMMWYLFTAVGFPPGGSGR